MTKQTAPMRVLIVDDDSALLDALSQTLRLRFDSIVLDVCDSAAEAIGRIASEDYDTIISDIKMPGMDGIELLSRIQEAKPDVPVLLITGHGETDLAIRALRGNAYDLIQKPIDRDYVTAALTRSFELRTLRRELQQKQEALARHAEHLEQEVEARTLKLRLANRAKDEFLGLVSHELRTPLTVIVGNAELLHKRSEWLNKEDKEMVIADLRQESRRLQRIIENLLILGRDEVRIKAKTETVSLARVIEDQIAAHRQFFPAREIRLHLAGDALIEAYPTYLELVVANLLSNAEKYSEPHLPIEVVTHLEEGEITVSVLDRGRGFTPEEVESIFEPFYRSDAVLDKVPGAGIGLAVCKRLVEAHSGTLSAFQRPGGGSEFMFRLPASLPARRGPETALIGRSGR